MRWIVKPPKPLEPCYYYQLAPATMDGTPADRLVWTPAYLTYNLSAVDRERRNLLLVKRTPSFRRSSLLNAEDLVQLAAIEERIVSQRHIHHGALSTAKSLVNEIYATQPSNSPLAVAVHKLGPVPVYLLSETATIELLGKRLEAQVGIYQDVTATTDSGRWPRATPNRREFFLSLQPHLTLILRRYFEDIAEYFFDIENHLPLEHSAYACRKIQEILGVSVDTKVEDILVFSDSQTEEGELARELASKYRYDLSLAQVGRAMALLMMNELLDILGLESRSYKYWKDLHSLQAEADLKELETHSGADSANRTELRDLVNAHDTYWKEHDKKQ